MTNKVDERIKAGRANLPRIVCNALWQVEDVTNQYYHVNGIDAESERVEYHKSILIDALKDAISILEST